jgi:uncharacterized membrane protein YgcG
MRHWLLAVGGVLTAGAAVASAQASFQDKLPGYLVIRVLVDSGAGGGAGPMPPGFPPGGFFPGDPGSGDAGSGDGLPGDPGGGFAPPGFPGPFGGFRPGGNQPAQPQQTEAAPSVVAVVPYTLMENRRFDPMRGGHPEFNPLWPTIKHKYGTSFIYADNTSIQVFPLRAASLERPIRNKYSEWARNRKDFNQIYDLATDALRVGMIDEAFRYCNDMLKQAEITTDQSPPAKVQAFAKAYKQIAPQLAAPPTQTSHRGEEWMSRLGATAIAESQWYALIHWSERQLSSEDIERRLRALDNNLKAFYLWHALQGIALPLPQQRLIAVLADRANDMPKLHQALDGLPVGSDGFYSPTHDLLVLSPDRLDQHGSSFARIAQAQYAVGWNRDDLLKGKVPKVRDNNRQPSEIARMMTIALVDKFLEEEADHAAISREGSRQLFVASGVLARNVVLPRWVDSGTSSFFEKPKGPVFTRSQGGGSPGGGGSGVVMTVGLGAGYGAANYVLHRHFRDLVQKQELNPAPEQTLKNILTDRYYEAVKDGVDVDPPPQNQPGQTGGPMGGPPGPGGAPGFGPPGGPMPPGVGGPPRPMPPGGGPPRPMPPGGGGMPGPDGDGDPEGGGIGAIQGGPPRPGSGNQPTDPLTARRKSREKLQIKADSTAWALIYFLAKTKTEGLHKFYAELRRMPRDMKLDDNTVLMTFCRCFNLTTPDQKSIDEVELKRFAVEWLDYMKYVPSYGHDIALDASSLDPGSGRGQQPGGGFPGGMFPGGPGGGGAGLP